jgi:hypothetical protein
MFVVPSQEPNNGQLAQVVVDETPTELSTVQGLAKNDGDVIVEPLKKRQVRGASGREQSVTGANQY